MSEPDDIQFLQQYLAGRSVACPSCRYDVRSLVEDRCPECGEQLCLRLEMQYPRLGSFVAGLIGLSASAGFGGIMFVLSVALRSGPGDSIMVPITLQAVFAILVIFAWFRGYRRLRRRGPIARWGLALACWLLPAAQIVVVILQV